LVPIADDFGVPSSKIPETIRRAQAISKKHNVMISTFGHVGDGNVHTTFVADVRSRDDWNRLRAAAEDLVSTAIAMKGTLSAEHGTGLTRAPHIEMQLGAAMDVMRRLKSALDPENILNPGKMGLEGAKSDIYDHFAFQALIEHPEGVNSFGRDIDDEVLACIHCGFCRLGCPTFTASHRESRNARGRNALAFYLMNGSVAPSAEMAAAFYSCTACQACTYFCPAQIKVDEIVAAVRKKLYQAGLVPESVLALKDSILKTGNVFASPRTERTQVYPPALKAKLAAGDRAEAADTLLFMGCVPSYLDMKMIPSLVRPLDAAGVRYTALAADENCCGFPLYLMGSERFEPHAQELVARIRKTRTRDLVTPCAGCYKAFKKLYPQVGELGLDVHHVVQYLESLKNTGRLTFGKGFPKRVTYHDPCDLGRAFKIFDPPRRLLLSIPELDYVEMAHNRLQARCCGGGGGVGAYDPEMATRMAAERVRDALEVGADVLVSACAACKDNLRKGARSLPRSERGKLKIMDITEVVAAAIE
jgi:glycolate oxidase